MRIVARGAGGFLIDNMETMAAALALAVDGTETLIAKNAFAAMAFVTEGFVRRAFRRVVAEHQFSFEQRWINRAVRAVCAGTARGGALVAIVAIGAGHEA